MKRLAIAFLLVALLAPFTFADVCTSPNKVAVQINTTANAQLITGATGKNIFVCSLTLSVAVATNVAIVEGTGSVCATATAGMTGGPAAATGLQLGTSALVTLGDGTSLVTRTAVKADNVCILVSAANQVSGVLTYVFSN